MWIWIRMNEKSETFKKANHFENMKYWTMLNNIKFPFSFHFAAIFEFLHYSMNMNETRFFVVYMTTSIRSDFIWFLSYASAAVIQYFINSKEQNALTTWNMYECVHIFHVIMNMNNNRICTNTIDIDLFVFFSFSLHFWLKLRNETTMLQQIMTWCSVHMHKIFTYI